jgi:hypothetical protein
MNQRIADDFVFCIKSTVPHAVVAGGGRTACQDDGKFKLKAG